MMDANGWVERKAAFDTAEDELLKLVKNAKEIAEDISSGWYPFYPSGETFQLNRKSDRKSFDVAGWPTGNQIREALVKCHQAYRELEECFHQLPEPTKKTLNILRMPSPTGEGF